MLQAPVGQWRWVHSAGLLAPGQGPRVLRPPPRRVRLGPPVLLLPVAVHPQPLPALWVLQAAGRALRVLLRSAAGVVPQAAGPVQQRVPQPALPKLLLVQVLRGAQALRQPTALQARGLGCEGAPRQQTLPLPLPGGLAELLMERADQLELELLQLAALSAGAPVWRGAAQQALLATEGPLATVAHRVTRAAALRRLWAVPSAGSHPRRWQDRRE